MRWYTSSTLILKKSRFKAFLKPIKSADEIPHLLKEHVKLDKNIANATHRNMYAWKTGGGQFGWFDDKEGGSGERILSVIDICRLTNIIIIVTRWYGGTPLGPDRFKCNSNVSIEALKNGGFSRAKGDKKSKVVVDCAAMEDMKNSH